MSSDEAEAPVQEAQVSPIASRFRGFMPVIVDVETGGFNCATDALLEIAAEARVTPTEEKSEH